MNLLQRFDAWIARLLPAPPPPPEIRRGDVWCLKNSDPWAHEDKHRQVVILDRKEGWVRYSAGDLFPDCRLKESSFRYCYEPLERLSIDVPQV